MTKNRKILLDADVVSHFISAGEILLINQIYPKYPLYILDKVHAELQRWPSAKVQGEISLVLSNKIIRLMDFPEDDPVIKKEYARIKYELFKGDGESACLAVARYTKNILASSNLKDIADYCTMHDILYLTTMDFICEAFRTGLFSLDRCNLFIQNVLLLGSKLPVKKLEQYNCIMKNLQ